MRVQEIAKVLTKKGMVKMSWNKKENCVTGDYEIKKFDFNGIYATVNVNTGIFNSEKSGQTIEAIETILRNAGLRVENKRGVLAIFK
jgi:hypothetical protein